MKEDIFSFSDEVAKALQAKKPVVGIETAGVFEGFPYPDNMMVAHKVIETIKEAGAVPAFIAILAGKVHVGLSEEEMLTIANPGRDLMKSSRRDIPALLAKKEPALTSIASAMMLSHLAGIQVVTGGGMGGVHREASTTFDISADLQVLASTPVILVCSGAKSILDLRLTMEYLETYSVPIVGYGTNELPAYMTRTSGIPLDFRIDSPPEAVEIFSNMNALDIHSGLLVANPIPEEWSLDGAKMEAAINEALEMAKKEGVTGKVITRYILRHVTKVMGPDSKETSLALNLHNARLAAEIAQYL